MSLSLHKPGYDPWEYIFSTSHCLIVTDIQQAKLKLVSLFVTCSANQALH